MPKDGLQFWHLLVIVLLGLRTVLLNDLLDELSAAAAEAGHYFGG